MKGSKENPFIKQLLHINANPQNRVRFTQQLLQQPELILEVIALAKDKSQEVSGKASRALELVCIQDLQLIFAHIESIFQIIERNRRDDVIRPMAKILELWVLNYFSKTPKIKLQEDQKEKITSICFDWMITPQKVASQAYSLQTLYLLGKEIPWIHPELKIILEQNYPQASSGYQARSRKILSKITI